jgi:zinc D-Ala-D-Ala dipeptidase
MVALLLALAAPAAARDRARTMPKGFVYLRDLAPNIAQDIRYATSDNFTGHPLPGYEAPECVLRRAVAAALARVQADLAEQHLGLKVYDCYRPARASRAFLRWANDPRSGGVKRFYPHVPKSELFARGYIAAHSRHSAGIAVDLTLIALPARRVAAFARSAHYGPCTAPAAERAPDNSLDMGTGFDCLDVKSTTRSGKITRAQRHWRDVLKAAMTRQGFRNYFREWWHFEFAGGPRRAYDFPILPRGQR